MSQSVVPAPKENQVETPPKLTFEEYRFYQGDPDVLYELYKGQLIPMAAATGLHTSICEFLVYKLQRYLATQKLDLVAKTSVGVRTEEDTSRIPDVVVCTQNNWEQVCARSGSGILDFGETPRLTVEVVSEDRRQDYVIKRAEYELAEVPEYWIVDPKKQRVRIYSLLDDEESYTFLDYQPDQEIVSLMFPNLGLSVSEVLNPPVVEDLIKAEQARLQQLEQQVSEERQRAERLAVRLREMGVDPDSI